MKELRIAVSILAALLIVTMIGGALIAVQLAGVTKSNSDFICSFGSALNKTAVKRRPEETRREFAKRVEVSREFVRKLNEIQDCNPPAAIRVDPTSRDDLHPNRPGHSESAIRGEGGGSQQTSPSSQQPSPPSGGPVGNPPTTGDGGNGGGNGAQPAPGQPPEPDPPLLNIDPNAECQLNAAGIRVCL